ncbi:GntR family transcriptional regulator [Devosia ginsengisoli]|uniref:GntR family transcriptional regulator n=1 Tax=Devosia ginsengisoli TaxID=400770 RepID=UPI0026EB3365|nr:GntR family transcriptional regulator [Devosia ginsengisoli]MCR6670757.1 GntR family transcriptional regulator [Devosia ginsengisoli]
MPNGEAEHDFDETGVRPRAGGPSIVRMSLSQQTYEAIKERILDRRYPPNMRINIDSLARELSVSSSPIREALAKLKGEQLVVSAQYSGYTVAPQPSVSYLEDLLAYRLLIEPYCAFMGAQRKDSTVIAQMERMVLIMREHSLGQKYKQYRHYLNADNNFHQVLVASAGNQVFSSTYANLQAIIVQSRLYLHRNGSTAASADGTREHQDIYDAFVAGDGEAARLATLNHLNAGRQRLLDRVKSELA